MSTALGASPCQCTLATKLMQLFCNSFGSQVPQNLSIQFEFKVYRLAVCEDQQNILKEHSQILIMPVKYNMKENNTQIQIS